MNKLVAGLALSTCAFAATAYYFHGELAAARERHPDKATAIWPSAANALGVGEERGAGAEAGSGSPAAVPTNHTIPSNQGAPGTANGPPATVGPSTAPLSANATRKAPSAAWAADFFSQYDSRSGRADLRAQELVLLGRSLAGLQEKLGIDDAKWDKFQRMMVEHEMAVRAAYARCEIHPACKSPDPRLMERFEYTEQAIRELLGRSDYKTMREEYRALSFERGVVANLQEHLPANLALSARQSEALAVKLREVRITQLDELAARGLDPGSFGGPGVSVVYPRGSTSQQQGMESAQQYMQTVRDYAGTILNAGQLAVYNQMLDDAMVTFRRYHRQQYAQQP